MSYPEWLLPVDRIFRGLGVPYYIWLPIAYQESRLDPGAKGDGGLSVGLFQLYTAGGQGDGMTLDQLVNPVLNAARAVTAIAGAYRTYGDNIIEVARHSGHPNENLSPGDPWLTEMARLSTVLKTKTADSLEAYDLLINNVTPSPGDQSDPTNPGSKPGDGTGVPGAFNPWQGLADALGGTVRGLGASLAANTHTTLKEWGPTVGGVVVGAVFLFLAVNGAMGGVKVNVGGKE